MAIYKTGPLIRLARTIRPMLSEVNVFVGLATQLATQMQYFKKGNRQSRFDEHSNRVKHLVR
jgi:hypothetical protein